MAASIALKRLFVYSEAWGVIEMTSLFSIVFMIAVLWIGHIENKPELNALDWVRYVAFGLLGASGITGAVVIMNEVM